MPFSFAPILCNRKKMTSLEVQQSLPSAPLETCYLIYLCSVVRCDLGLHLVQSPLAHPAQTWKLQGRRHVLLRLCKAIHPKNMTLLEAYKEITRGASYIIPAVCPIFQRGGHYTLQHSSFTLTSKSHHNTEVPNISV